MNDKLKIALIVFGVLGATALVIILIAIIGGTINDKKFEKELLEEYNEIEFDVPSDFEQYSKFHSYSYYGDGISCRFEVNASKKYEEDFEKWFKRSLIVSLNDEVGELKEIEINGKKALSVEIISNDRVEHHYALISPNYYYGMEYSISNNGNKEVSPEHICYISEDKILSTVKIKE